MTTKGQYTPRSAFETNLFYHILIKSTNDSKVDAWDITAESLDEPEPTTISPNTIIVHQEPDLTVFESSVPSNPHIICIKPSYSKGKHYFRVAATHTATDPRPEKKCLALRLKRNKEATEKRMLKPLTLKAKIDLAYDLVRCDFYRFRYTMPCIPEEQGPTQNSKRKTNLFASLE